MTMRVLILRRLGRAAIAPGRALGDPRLVQAAELELAELGYVVSRELRARLLTLDAGALRGELDWMCEALWATVGGNQKHVPLFRKFPDGVPADTWALWLDKVLSHYLQEPHQPCLFCGRSGTTHVLKPCAHVVCERCWDGANLSRCPVCEHAVEPGSPFFVPGADFRVLSTIEKVTYKLLDLSEDPLEDQRRLFLSLAQRTQVMNPDDVSALQALVREAGRGSLPWIPAAIPVRENRALIFGTLLGSLPHEEVLAAARPHMGTATDLMRLLAVMSGAGAGLLKTARTVPVDPQRLGRWSQRSRSRVQQLQTLWKRLRGAPIQAALSVQSAVFKPAKLPRKTRRAILEMLDGFNPESLTADMLRYRSLWVRVGEALHPFEHARRFPNAARAFAVVRESTGPLAAALADQAPPSFSRDPRGCLRFHSFNAITEGHIRARDGAALGAHLSARPGELARRLDLALCLSAPADRAALAARFLGRVGQMATPTLLTLKSGLEARSRRAPQRVFFPKSAQFTAPSAKDTRAELPQALTGPLADGIREELLRRFAEEPPFGVSVLDQALDEVVVPFNERSASPAAVNLPRGSTLHVEKTHALRLFLHWCEPAGGHTTDLDLSVALYDSTWRLSATCSYYQLETAVQGRVVARSSGDMRDAPPPDGASEFVDLYRDAALQSGLRYAVMVVNAYAGLPFSRLDRAFAGIMTRDDLGSAFFDPRTVQLRFNLQGEHGCYLPLVYDIERSALFWLDASSKGQFALNNVAKSDAAISRICPETMAYFASRVRPSMFQLAALHAAARSPRVLVRGSSGVRVCVRSAGESAPAFYRRIVGGGADETLPALPALDTPVFAALLRGDLSLPKESAVYALFREQLTDTLAAADLLS